MTRSQAVAIGRAIEAEHRQRVAAALHETRVAGGKACAAKRAGLPFIPRHASVGCASDVAAAAVGMAPGTYRAARAVSSLPRRTHRRSDIAIFMDSTGNVAAAYRELERRRGGLGHGQGLRHPVHAGAPRTDPNRAVARLADALEGLVHGLSGLDLRRADGGETQSSLARIRAALDQLRRADRRLSTAIERNS